MKQLVVMMLLAFATTLVCAQAPTGNYTCAGNQSDIFVNTCTSDTCYDEFPVTPVSGFPHTTYYQERAFNCCGLEGTYWAAIGSCGFAELKDPKIHRKLLELAETTTLLLPDCNGIYLSAESVLNFDAGAQDE